MPRLTNELSTIRNFIKISKIYAQSRPNYFQTLKNYLTVFLLLFVEIYLLIYFMKLPILYFVSIKTKKLLEI